MYKDFLKKSENKTLKNYNEFDIWQQLEKLYQE
jgi:hypothetical protein